MGLNEDLGDRENIGNASVAAQRARELKSRAAKFEFLDENFLELMNEIGRLGHKKFGSDAFEATGGVRRIDRHRKDDILRHARKHLLNYENGAQHDKLGAVKYHLAAAAFNCMLEFIFFSQGE